MPLQGETPPQVDAASAVEAHLGATPRIGDSIEEGDGSVISPLLETTPSNGVEVCERGRVDFRSVSFGYPTRSGEATGDVEVVLRIPRVLMVVVVVVVVDAGVDTGSGVQ